MKLEAAIHQYRGNKEKSEKWLERFGLEKKELRKVILGEFLYFTGSHLEVLPATRTYIMAQED